MSNQIKKLKKDRSKLGIKYVATLEVMNKLVNFDHYSSKEARDYFISTIDKWHETFEDDLFEYHNHCSNVEDSFHFTKFLDKILEK